jgi:pyrroline-5-carboxylate reductase
VRIGLIGAGNMARALALGWGEPVLVSDGGSGRAAKLAAETGGEALSSAELAARADVVVLACKPYHLDTVAPDLQAARRVVSVLAATSLERLRAALPGAAVLRTMPNTPVELRRGVIVVAQESDADPEVRALLERVGQVVDLPERLMDVGTGTTGAAPAYLAVVAEAMIDAAVKHGVPAATAVELVVGALEGSAALLRERGGDTLAVRRAVASPGGSTVKGLAALERAGLRAAFIDALDAILAE